MEIKAPDYRSNILDACGNTTVAEVVKTHKWIWE